MKRGIGAVVVCGVFGWASGAQAQSVEDSSVIVGAEHVFGIQSWRMVASPAAGSGDAETEQSGTQVNLLGANPTHSGSLMNPSAAPRVAIHGVIGSGVTLGGFFAIMLSSGESQEGTERSRELTDMETLALGPRVGFVAPVGNSVALWPRGGLTYASSTLEQADGDRFEVNYLQFSLDPGLIILPAPNVGILLNPNVDLSITGGWETTDAQDPSQDEHGDLSMRSIGINAGLIAFF